MQACAIIRTGWVEPVAVLGAHADHPHAFALLSDGQGERGRWSYIGRDPDAVRLVFADDTADPFTMLDELLGEPAGGVPGGPPFQGGVVGLCAYELGARVDGMQLARREGWPDLVLGLYRAILAFDHQAREVIAIGRGADDDHARRAAERALGWLQGAAVMPFAGPLADRFESDDGEAYEAAVSDITGRIAAGEIFQANVARQWRGRLKRGVRPFDLTARLHRTSPAPYAAYLRLEHAAVVSNSPERFVNLLRQDGGWIAECRPIKGTAPRGATVAADALLAQDLSVSPKDRAENLMIVDLMRNDLSRVCVPGTVTTPELFRVETFANVHHLVSTVRGRLKDGVGPGDLLRATFPPGSITGAPKVQAMTVIAGLEPPRGPFFGAMFWAGFDGAFDANVLIRTAAFTSDGVDWDLEARAGGGIVADSDPLAERLETEAKIDALRRALTGDGR